MKKVFALVLALAMMLAVATTFADTIDLQNVLDGETYTAYKILNYTESEDGKAVSYYLTSEEYTSMGPVLVAAGFEFTPSVDGTQYVLHNADVVDVSAVASYLKNHLDDLGSALGTTEATGNGGSASFTGLDKGYYFVTSSVGSLCALHDEDGIETVVEKNTVPTVDKKERIKAGDNESEKEYEDGPIDGKYGDTINYEIIVTDGTGTDKAITLTDTMSAGLDYTAGSLTINGAAVADNADTADWKVTVSGRTITIELKAAYVATVDTEEKITVTFDATLNKDAVVDDEDANSNKVVLEYSEQSTEDEVFVETYDFQLKKTDGSNFLDGAEFKLYDASTGGNQILLSNDATGYFVDPDGSAEDTILVDSADGVNVRGLAPGTYYLEEVEAPKGYNKLNERTHVAVSSGATEPVEVTVINKAGTELPSTGGIGTTIFYVVGGLLVIGAAVILIARRKVSE